MKKRLLDALCFLLMFVAVSYAADEIRKLGVEDLEFGQGTATSTGGVVSTQINASLIPMKTGSDNVDTYISSNYQPISDSLTDLSDGVLASNYTLGDGVRWKFGTDNDFHQYYDADTGTLIIALDNGSSVCVFNKSLGLVCTGEITASQYNTTAANGERYIDASNTSDPTPGENSYPIQYRSDLKKLRVWNGTSWDNLAIEAAE